jgi:RNA-directed DNA polymerase
MTNEAGEPAQRDPAEGRERRITEPFEGKMNETSGSTAISTKLERIATLARDAPEMAFTTLAHHVDLAWLREAYRLTRKDGATGVDRQTAAEYATNLEDNLRSLLERAKSGTYRAPPVRRVHIPKGCGPETRPLGIPTFEDKVLQRAVTMVLEAVYEQDFLPCSYGFRPGRSAHQALQALWDQTTRTAGGWVVELDIRKYFDSIDHGHLREVLRRRVLDGVLLRLIGKWLNAGVLENEALSYPRRGSPQGGVISPLLANILLHEVLDAWFENVVRPRMRGQVRLVRYADDAVLIFERKDDAERVMAVLPKRFEKYGLTLHPQKTRIVEFVRPDRRSRRVGPAASLRSGTFDFLGFTHHWGCSRKGKLIVRRKTAKDRFSRSLKQIAQWCRWHRHDDLRVQQKALAQKLLGHYGYFGIVGNTSAMKRFLREVQLVWCKWIQRRSQRGRKNWAKLNVLLQRYALPQPRSVSSVYRTARP